MHLPRKCLLLPVVIMTTLVPSITRANIAGFGDFSGFSINQVDAASAPAIFDDAIMLTTGAWNYRSIFNNTPQDVSRSFKASFTYQALNVPVVYGDQGVCFVLQNSVASGYMTGAGPTAVGGVKYGYNGMNKSLGVTLELYSPGASGMYTGGAYGGGSALISPVDLLSGHPISVVVSYNGSILHEELTDTITGGSFSRNYSTNLPLIVGASTAYVGITATTSNYGANQTLSNFQFTTVPEPVTLIMLAGVGITMAKRRRHVANAGK